MERIVTSMYKVISYFTDLQDFNHPYKVGDEFPRLGLKVSEDRLKELSSKKNKQGKPLIEKVTETAEVTYTKTEINRMSTAELKELATSKGIEGAKDMTGADLKKVLIEKFGL